MVQARELPLQLIRYVPAAHVLLVEKSFFTLNCGPPEIGLWHDEAYVIKSVLFRTELPPNRVRVCAGCLQVPVLCLQHTLNSLSADCKRLPQERNKLGIQVGERRLNNLRPHNGGDGGAKNLWVIRGDLPRLFWRQIGKQPDFGSPRRLDNHVRTGGSWSGCR